MKAQESILGTRVRETITGFEGVATACIQYLWGCIQIQVTPGALHEGKPVEEQWFDIDRLEAAKAPAKKAGKTRKAAADITGGPPPHSLPSRNRP